MKLTGIYTTGGAAMATQAAAGGKTLTITQAAAGSGTTAVDAAALTGEKQALSILRQSAQGGQSMIEASLVSSQAGEEYVLREVGLYAQVEGGAEALFKIFTMDESLTVEPGTELSVTFYLTESLLLRDDVAVTVDQTGLATQRVCDEMQAEAIAQSRAALETHKSDGSAHAALFAKKAAVGHTHTAGEIGAGTLAGRVAAQTNTLYDTAQLRNIILSAESPSGGDNGAVWIQYES